jgi:hypothetical protein
MEMGKMENKMKMKMKEIIIMTQTIVLMEDTFIMILEKMDFLVEL